MYTDFLARQGGKIVCIRGIFHAGNGRPYGTFFYDSISDQFSGQELGIKIPEGRPKSGRKAISFGIRNPNWILYSL